MNAKLLPPALAENTLLVMLGERLCLARKRRARSAEDLAAEAGVTRVTLRRVELGEPTVMMGSYLRVLAALGLAQDLVLVARDDSYGRRLQDEQLLRRPKAIRAPARIRLAEYPMLREIAWSTHPTASLTPAEAFAIYERNWRHLDHDAMEPREQDLVARLTATVGKGVLLVQPPTSSAHSDRTGVAQCRAAAQAPLPLRRRHRDRAHTRRVPRVGRRRFHRLVG